MFMLSLCVVPLAVFMGLSAAANERSRGTLPFLQTPRPPTWRTSLTKMVFGLSSLILAVVLTLPLFYGWNLWLESSHHGDSLTVRQMNRQGVTGNYYLDVVLISTTLAASLFIWSAASGVNRKDEVSAGAVALAAIVGWYFALFLVGYLLFRLFEPWSGNAFWYALSHLIALLGL